MSDAEQSREPAPDEAEADTPDVEDPDDAEAAPDTDDAEARDTDDSEAAPDTDDAEARDTDDSEAAPDTDDAQEASEPAEEQPPRKRKTKRKKRQPEPAQPKLRPARDADGRDRPRFLLSFPHDPELEELIEAYERGDYAKVRREAEDLAERTESEAVSDAALELRRRIDPDPLMRYLLLTGVALLTFLIIWVYAGHR